MRMGRYQIWTLHRARSDGSKPARYPPIRVGYRQKETEVEGWISLFPLNARRCLVFQIIPNLAFVQMGNEGRQWRKEKPEIGEGRGRVRGGGEQGKQSGGISDGERTSLASRKGRRRESGTDGGVALLRFLYCRVRFVKTEESLVIRSLYGVKKGFVFSLSYGWLDFSLISRSQVSLTH